MLGCHILRETSYLGEMSMQIVIKLAASAIDSSSPATICPSAGRALIEVCSRRKIELVPMHPGVRDAELGTYFKAQVPDAQAADILQELQHTSGVEAAYSKPADAMP